MVAEYPTSYRNAGVRGFSGRPDFELPTKPPGRTGFPANNPRGPRRRVDVRTRIPRTPRSPVARAIGRARAAAAASAAMQQPYAQPGGQKYPDAATGFVYVGEYPTTVSDMEAANPAQSPFEYQGIDAYVRRVAASAWAGALANVGSPQTGLTYYLSTVPVATWRGYTVPNWWWCPDWGSGTEFHSHAALYGKSGTDTPAPIPTTAPLVSPIEVPQLPNFPAYTPPINFVESGFVTQAGVEAQREVQQQQDPYPDEHYQPEPAPAPRTAPNARPTAGVEFLVGNRGPVTVGPATHEPLRPPRDGTREKKGRTPFDAGFSGWADMLGFDVKRPLDNVTELLDILEATYFSIPEDVRPVATTPQEQAMAIYEHFDEIPFDEWAKNIIAMELQDQLLGQASRQATQGLRDYGFGGTFFGPLL